MNSLLNAPQRPSLVTVVEWIDYETLALLFGMVSLKQYTYHTYMYILCVLTCPLDSFTKSFV